MCYFEVRNLTILQTIGIPIRIEPAPHWANLYLSKHECDFMGKLITDGIARAKRFHGNFRFHVHYCRFENLPICLCSYKDITLKISLS